MIEGPEKEEILFFKLFLLGDTSIWKSSFILHYYCDKFEEEKSLAIIGSDQTNKFVKIDDKKILLNKWDTTVQESFRSFAKYIIKDADGIILMYDMSNYNSFKAIKTWIKIIEESIDITKIGIIIVGNKCDLPENEKK